MRALFMVAIATAQLSPVSAVWNFSDSSIGRRSLSLTNNDKSGGFGIIN